MEVVLLNNFVVDETLVTRQPKMFETSSAFKGAWVSTLVSYL